MQFDYWSLALQTINLIVLVWLLRRFLFKPVLAFVARRQSAIEAALAEAGGKLKAAEAQRAQYDQKLAAATAEREALIAAARADMTRERTQLLEDAKIEAKKILDRGQQLLTNDRDALVDDLLRRSCRLAADISTRLLADIAGPNIDELFLQRLDTYIAELPPPRADALRASLQRNGAIEVITAQPMDESRQEYWRQRLAQLLPHITTSTFRNDPALVAGVEIHYSTGRIDFSWRKALEDAQLALTTHETAA